MRLRYSGVPVLSLLLLAGCGQLRWGDVLYGQSLWDGTLWAEVGRVLEPADPPDPPNDAALPEGRTLRYALGRRSGTARPVQEIGERRLWRDRGGLVVATDGARVVATSGLPEVLAATRFDGPDPLANPALLLDQPAEAWRVVDLMRADREPDGMRFGISVQCRLRATRSERDATLLLVEERCRAKGTERFTNRFWADAETGAILRAEQWVGQGVPPMVVEFNGPAS